MSNVCGNCKLFEENSEQIKNEWNGKCKYEGYKSKNKLIKRNWFSDSCNKIDYIEEPFKLHPNKDGLHRDEESNRFE